MATVLVVTYLVDEDVDPTLEDPEVMAEDLLEMHREDMTRNGRRLQLTGLLEASWTTV